MNNESSKKLAGVIELLLESSSRINEAKPQRYWYPLSIATYGVEEIVEAIDSMCSFRTTMWEKTSEFERAFCAYQECKHAIMVNSGSSADLLLSFLLTNPYHPYLEKNSEILVSALTWPTQIWSAMMAGLKVRLVDVDPDTLNMNLDDVESQITAKTKAIFLVHLMGNPCDMDRVLEITNRHNLFLLEDCCEALGSSWNGVKVGNFGLGGAFSFFFSHHMTTMEGGMITCKDDSIADHLRILRAHGWMRNVQSDAYNLAESDLDSRYAFHNWGFNVRPTEIQASFGLRQIEKLPGFNDRRKQLATKFFEVVDRTPYLSHPVVEPKGNAVWFALPMLVTKSAPFSRNEITAYLESEGVETRPIVVGNITRHPVASLFKEFQERTLPGADVVHNQGFYLGLSPLYSDSTFDRLMDCMESFLRKF